MNDQTFAEEVKAVLEQELASVLGRAGVPATDDTPEIVGYPFHFSVGQTADSGSRPLLVIYGKYNSYANGFRLGELHLMLRSHFGDEDADPLTPLEYTHQSRFERIYDFLLGVPNAERDPKAQMRFLVSLRGKVEMFDYCPAPEESIEATVDDQEFVTTLNLRVAFRHLQV